jgi:hypothetical protein
MLFQQTTLLDLLTVATNILMALENCPSAARNKNGSGGGGGGGG